MRWGQASRSLSTSHTRCCGASISTDFSKRMSGGHERRGHTGSVRVSGPLLLLARKQQLRCRFGACGSSSWRRALDSRFHWDRVPREDVAMTLPVGLALPTTPELTRPSALAELAGAAEQLGYAHLWVSDHVLLPTGSHVPADHQLDPFASLAWLAARTRRIRLGTSVLVLPYRGAAATAKTLATIDWLSGGRLTVGVGAGWLRAEFAALGVPFDERGRRTDEAIHAMRDLWAGHGELTCLPAG